MKRAFVFLAIGLWCSQAAVAQMYKCNEGGKTFFSDRPCGNNAKKMYGAESSDAATAGSNDGGLSEGAKLCAAVAPASGIWKDPESVRIGKIIGGHMEIIDYAYTKIAARRYIVPINAKNSYGGYTGEKNNYCYTNQLGTKVLKFNNLEL